MTQGERPGPEAGALPLRVLPVLLVVRMLPGQPVTERRCRS